MFEIEFVDVGSGCTVRRKVPSHQLARQLAKDLAMATGRRAIVRRAEPSFPRKWRMVIVDLEMLNCVEGQRFLSTGQAWKYFKSWDFERTKAIAIPWPEELPVPDFSIRT